MDTLATIAVSALASSGLFSLIQFLINRKDSKSEGIKCLLRTEILSYYYKHEEDHTLRQFERENIDRLYTAYKALKGNSFIDDIYAEMREWKVIS